jgi:hypothetical protein
LREERRLRVFENRVLRRTIGPKSEQLKWECRKLNNGEILGLYSSPTIVLVINSKRMR